MKIRNVAKNLVAVLILSWVGLAQALARGPALAVKWMPSDDLTEVIAVVTNNGPKSISVDQEMTVLDSGFNHRPPLPWPPERTRGTILVVVTPLDDSGHRIHLQLRLARPVGYPVEIGPGATRKVRVVVEGTTIGPDAARVRLEAVTFALWRDGKKLTSETFARKAGWNRW